MILCSLNIYDIIFDIDIIMENNDINMQYKKTYW